MCISVERTYRSGSGAAAAARAFGVAAVIANLATEGWPVADDIASVLSELVSEAVEVGAQSVHVVVRMHWDRVDIEVGHDGGGTPAVHASPSDARAVRNGILSALTSSMQATTSETGHVLLRATLPCEPVWAAGVACMDRPPA